MLKFRLRDHSHLWYQNNEYDVTEELPTGTLHPSLQTDNACQALGNLFTIITDEYENWQKAHVNSYIMYYNFAELGKFETVEHGENHQV